MTDAKLHILQHSLGLDQYGRGSMYRNHFVTGEGSVDYSHCQALVAEGLMTRSAGSPLTGGDDLFRVTDAGKAYVLEHSPAPPKVSRARLRYEQFLDADSSFSFGEWLQRGLYKPDVYSSWCVDAPAYDAVPF